VFGSIDVHTLAREHVPMSAKRARAKRHRMAAPAATSAPQSAATRTTERPRRDAARHRARAAKALIGAVAVVTAAVAMALARVTYAGHAKHATPPLAIPQPLYNVVRQNLLQAGILAPATAPTSIVTGSS
jgi:hypothetical protein